MRDIKFRGKHIDNGKWVYGNNIQIQIDGSGRVCICEHANQRWLDPNTVGQFTGMCDKNGKEIFDGDILNTEKYQIVEVIFDNGAFMTRYFLNNGMEHRIMFWDLGAMEVIGNIHDNPELMKGSGA